MNFRHVTLACVAWTVIGVMASPGQAQTPPPPAPSPAFERAYLMEALRRCAGNVSAAARLAGRNRSDFYDLMRRHALSPGEFKAD